MIGTPERIALEGLNLGEASVRVLKTIDGQYGLHGQTGWDDLPHWEYHDAWIIATQAHGRVSWGPWRYRENSRREHSGTAQLQILEPRIFRSEKEAENYATEEALGLESKGFRVRIEFGNAARTILNTERQWIANQPPKSFGQYRPSIQDLGAE